MTTVSISEAKANLSKLVERAAAGDDVIIARRGKPLVTLTRLEPASRRIRFGLLEGKIKIAEGFDEPLPDKVLAGFAAQ